MRDPGLKALVALIFRGRQVVTGGRRILLFVFPHDVTFRASSSIDENMKYLTGKCWTTRVLEALFLGDVVLGDHLQVWYTNPTGQQGSEGSSEGVDGPGALDNLPIIQPPSFGSPLPKLGIISIMIALVQGDRLVIVLERVQRWSTNPSDRRE